MMRYSGPRSVRRSIARSASVHPGERIYTFWDYFRNAWARNAGLRIDHLLLSPSIVDRLIAADVDRQVRSWEKASDHAPTWIGLGNAGKDRTRRRRGPMTSAGRNAGWQPQARSSSSAI